jgi:hypothetical protein
MIISDLPGSNALADPAAIGAPGVGMVSYRTGWSSVQPNQPIGVVPTSDPNDPSFYWGFLDSAVAQATQYGKLIFLRLICNKSNAPAWVESFSQTYVAANSVEFFVWWDPGYQAYLIAVIQAMAARYGNNPLVRVFSCNPVAQTGDWSMPHVAPSSNPTGASNWTIQSSFTCPPFQGTVSVTPNPNQKVTPAWVVKISNFGWFFVQGVTGDRNNPSSVLLKNLGYSGNASGGVVPSTAIMQVSDIDNLESPMYGYTTAKLVGAVTDVLSAGRAAWPSNVVISTEVGRNGTLDPFPASQPIGNWTLVQQATGAATGGNPYTLPYPSLVSDGSQLVAVFSYGNTVASIVGLSDNLNGDWSQVYFLQTQSRTLSVWMYNGSVTGSCTVSANLSTTTLNPDFQLYEFAGPTMFLDQVASGIVNPASPTVVTSTITPTYASDLVLACVRGTSIASGGVGWNFQATGNSGAQFILPNSLSPISATFTQANTNAISLIIAFNSTAGGGPTFQYNAATQIAQWAYANLPLGSFSIEKNTINTGNPIQSRALALQDGSDLYLPAQTLPGSSNTSGTAGTIPPNSLLYFQFLWKVTDASGQYLPSTTTAPAGTGGAYGANGGVPYNNPFPVFAYTIQIIQTYTANNPNTVIEAYEVDILSQAYLGDLSPSSLNQGGTFLLRNLLSLLFAAGQTVVRDINGNYYNISDILGSGNYSLLNAIVYYNPDSKRITFSGTWNPNPLIDINQFVLQSPQGTLSVSVPPAPPGGIAPDTLQFQGGVAPYLYDVVSPV